ncbi:translesion DNA synthesis-associated protein ImuA [Pseudoalteromonas sp. Of7M-16]|uniref:translesion DNA synthesis-associated protein ImuA n=1 Tax=Pseudoalteromonas sp. Of7M-16 TaxID=2917756 RepID=UPI001EF4C24A|nr:translesion DNA synthesis-associated protein ImuA [Pseudoalteromonas sp. Of7M-16]MCG7548404.1 translesion DNA synthesis-associated protein ImuA [Pseudoalteromonas sp. Of7M-16]
MANLIDFLQHQNLVWQGTDNAPLTQRLVEKVSTGYDVLDAHLDGGFPMPGVVDIKSHTGVGEVRLLLPYIRSQSRLCVMINPPACINAHALLHQDVMTELVWVISTNTCQEALWAAEQCLKSGACGSVLLWHRDLQVHQVKRLLLSAQTGKSLCCLLRNDVSQFGSLPVSLCLQLEPDIDGLKIKVNKLRGGWAKPQLTLPWTLLWPLVMTQTEQTSLEAQVLPFLQPQRRASR